MDGGAWWTAVHGVAKSQTRLSDFTFTFHFHALEGEMVTHSSVLAWRIPGTGEPGGLSSMGSHRVGCNWSDLAAAAAAFTYMIYKNTVFCRQHPSSYSSLKTVLLSLVAASRRCSLLWCTGSRMHGPSSCGAWCLVASRHVESSRTRDWTHVPYIGRRILIHCSTRQVLQQWTSASQWLYDGFLT